MVKNNIFLIDTRFFMNVSLKYKDLIHRIILSFCYILYNRLILIFKITLLDAVVYTSP